jgi:hypothetical protein
MNDKPSPRPTRNGHEFGLTKRIRELNRILSHVSIRVRLPTCPRNRILTDEPSGLRTVIPVPIVNKRPDTNPSLYRPLSLIRQGFPACRLRRPEDFSGRDSRLIRISKQVNDHCFNTHRSLPPTHSHKQLIMADVNHKARSPVTKQSLTFQES